jgi:hypothetical protein
LSGAAIAFAPVAHADNDSDYINNLRSHGPSPVGISESQWETEVISSGHQICDMAAGDQAGMASRRILRPSTPTRRRSWTG